MQPVVETEAEVLINRAREAESRKVWRYTAVLTRTAIAAAVGVASGPWKAQGA